MISQKLLCTIAILTFSIIIAKGQNNIIGNNKKNDSSSSTLHVLECRGNLTEKTVTIFFRITNSSNRTHVIHIIDNGKAKAFVDTSNTPNQCLRYTLGSKTGGDIYLLNKLLLKDSSVVGSITYKNIPIDAKQIRKATFYQYNNILDKDNNQVNYNEMLAELYNVSIVWYKVPKIKPLSNYWLCAGVGINSIYFKEGYSKSSPINSTIIFEKKLTKLPINFGGSISYAKYLYTYQNDYQDITYYFNQNAIYVGLRTSYIFSPLLNLKSNIEAYVGVSVGYIFMHSEGNNNNSNEAKSGFASGLHIGTRYYPVRHFALFAEGGTSGLSYINFGLTTKF